MVQPNSIFKTTDSGFLKAAEFREAPGTTLTPGPLTLDSEYPTAWVPTTLWLSKTQDMRGLSLRNVSEKTRRKIIGLQLCRRGVLTAQLSSVFKLHVSASVLWSRLSDVN